MTNKEFSKKLLSRIIDNTYDADDFHNMMINIFGKSEYSEIDNDWTSILFSELGNSAEKALKEELERIGKEVDDTIITDYINEVYLDGIMCTQFWSEDGKIYGKFGDGWGYTFTTSEGHDPENLIETFGLTEEEVEELDLNDDTSEFEIANIETLCDWWIENSIDDIDWEYIYDTYVE